MTSFKSAGPAYYNEIDKYCAEWLRSLIRAGLIAPGDVDERDIREVGADEIGKYTQCHFFAGIGGWPLALRLASWDDTKPVWTGSCPCQPFSLAGRRRGAGDERHLWPVWFRLIRECRPAVLFGEQVAAAIAHDWLDQVAHDLEGEGYAVAASVLPACAVGAPHRRDRLWFVADAACQQLGSADAPGIHRASRPEVRPGRGGVPSDGAMGNAHQPGPQGRELYAERAGEVSAGAAGLEWIAGPDGKSRPVKPGLCLLADAVPGRVGRLRAYGNAIVPELAAEFIRAARGL